MKGLIRIKTAGLSEEQWQKLRSEFVAKGLVGGSDSGTLLGLNPYKSPINMFYQSVGLSNVPNKMNSAMLHGKQMEDYVAKCWQYYDGTEDGWVANTLADKKIKRYRRVKSIIQNPKYPELFANIDGMIVEHPDYGKQKGILEIKTINGYSSDKWEAGFPPSYLVQLNHYMLVMGLSYGEIAYLKDGRELGVVTFTASENIQQRIITAAKEFNNRVAEAKKAMAESGSDDPDVLMNIAMQFEPEADNTEAFNDFISERHKARALENQCQGDDTVEEWAIQHKKLSADIKEMESQKQLYTNRIKQYMEKEGASVLNLPEGGKVTWRKQFIVSL